MSSLEVVASNRHAQAVREDELAFIPGLRGLEGLARIADLYARQQDGGERPMQAYIWAKACAETFAPDDRLEIVAVGADGEPRAAAALVRPESGIGFWEIAGATELGEPVDLVYTDARALDALCRALVALGAPIRLARVPAGSPTIHALRRAYAGRGVVRSRPAKSCPTLAIDPSFCDPESHFSARRRGDFRRAQRNAEKLGAVSYEVRSPRPSELEGLLDEALRVEAASWKGKEGTALLHDRTRGEFFRRYAAAAAAEGSLRLCFMRIDGRAAAMALAVERAGKFWLLKIGYDDAFARCSPGSLLMLETVRASAARGLSAYELLGTADTWTRAWTEVEHPCVTVRAYPAAPRGLSRLAADSAAYGWKKLKERVSWST